MSRLKLSWDSEFSSKIGTFSPNSVRLGTLLGFLGDPGACLQTAGNASKLSILPSLRYICVNLNLLRFHQADLFGSSHPTHPPPCLRACESNCQLKDPVSKLEGSELLTSEFRRFRSRLNETSGRLGKIGAVFLSDCRILKFLRTTFLAAKLLGWKVSVKGIRSSLFEADGYKADPLLTFWTRLSALDMLSE